MPSTAIQSFSYDLQTRTLFVTFVDGDLYAYQDVEPEAYSAMQTAISKGRFFARHIRGRYAYVRLGEDALTSGGTGLAAERSSPDL